MTVDHLPSCLVLPDIESYGCTSFFLYCKVAKIIGNDTYMFVLHTILHKFILY